MMWHLGRRPTGLVEPHDPSCTPRPSLGLVRLSHRSSAICAFQQSIHPSTVVFILEGIPGIPGWPHPQPHPRKFATITTEANDPAMTASIVMHATYICLYIIVYNCCAEGSELVWFSFGQWIPWYEFTILRYIFSTITLYTVHTDLHCDYVAIGLTVDPD